MRWHRRRGVIYSLICCGNGQRIITCKILINVLQQQTSFAKLVICCSAPDSEQLNWHEQNKVWSGRVNVWVRTSRKEAEMMSLGSWGSHLCGPLHKTECFRLKRSFETIISWRVINVAVSRNKNFIFNRETQTAEGWTLNSFLNRQHRKQSVLKYRPEFKWAIWNQVHQLDLLFSCAGDTHIWQMSSVWQRACVAVYLEWCLHN